MKTVGGSSQPVSFAYPNDNENQCVSKKMNVSIEVDVSGASKSAMRVSFEAVGVDTYQHHQQNLEEE